jgi:hypothetical protein
VVVALNPPGQYAYDRSFPAGQRPWQHHDSFFDVVGSALSLAEPARHPVIK